MTLSFLTPWLLAGTALIAVPIIIHLILKKQPKHLIFPAFRFLQMKHRTNVQRLRLRHLLLLAMRMLLILLICLALARPQLSGRSSVLAGDAPIAVVLIFDTSASMEYEHDGKTRLTEAKDRATQFLKELPGASRVAVLDTAEPGGQFVSVVDGLKQVQTRQIRLLNRPVTASLEEAYRLLETESPPDLPILLCVLSDRTAATWNPEAVASYLLPLKSRVETKLGQPLPSVYLDLSAPELRNLAITGLAIKGAGSETAKPLEALTFGTSAAAHVQLQAAVEVAGANLDGELALYVDGQPVDTKRIQLAAPPGRTVSEVVTFSPFRLTSKVHQGEVRLKNRDPLQADNVRYWTLVVPERRVLIIADKVTDAEIWRAALESLQGLPMTCDVVLTPRVGSVLHPDQYQAVCLMNVANPSAALWQTLQSYVTEGGGLVVLPGEDCDPAAYGTEAALGVMPARLREKRELRPPGAFLAPPDYTHPVTGFFKEWERPNLSHWRVFKFWELEPNRDISRTIIPYNFEDKPALVERIFDGRKVRGRAVLFTTAMYRPRKDWNNYYEGWIYLGLSYSTIRYVLGAREEGQNFQLGDEVRFWLPRGPGFSGYLLTGPTPASGPVEQDQSQLAVRQAARPGNYRLTDPSGENWQRHFSMNLPPAETRLLGERPESSDLAVLFGAETVYSLAEDRSLLELVQDKLGQSSRNELLPLLMIAVLFLLAGEGLLANRFYRQESSADYADDADKNALKSATSV